jgi:RNA-directed DNA polymerase
MSDRTSSAQGPIRASALFIAKRHQRGRGWGYAQVYRSGNELGLISLNGIVIAPRPNRPWRAPVEHRR